jgi:Protein of unknown function (DUF3237)
MKKIVVLFLFFTAFSGCRSFAQELKSEFLFDLEISLDAPQTVGQVQTGIRLIYPFKDGTVKGDKINGKLLNPGADWGLVIDSTTFKVDVRTTLKTDDGSLIYITYFGYNHADAKNFARIGAGNGKDISPSDYYFRSAVFFETSAPKYAWLNHTIGVGVGRFPDQGKVAYRVYAIM